MKAKIWKAVTDPQEPVGLFIQLPDRDWVIFHRDELAIMVYCRQERRTLAEKLLETLPELKDFRVLQWVPENVPPLGESFKRPHVPAIYKKPKVVWGWTDGALDEDDMFNLGWWDCNEEKYIPTNPDTEIQI